MADYPASTPLSYKPSSSTILSPQQYQQDNISTSTPSSYNPLSSTTLSPWQIPITPTRQHIIAWATHHCHLGLLDLFTTHSLCSRHNGHVQQNSPTNNTFLLPGQPTAVISDYLSHLQGIPFTVTTMVPFNRTGLPTMPTQQHLVTRATHCHHLGLLYSFTRHSLCSHHHSPVQQNRHTKTMPIQCHIHSKEQAYQPCQSDINPIP